MNVLSKVHEALVPGGLVVDTQPIAAHPRVKSVRGSAGSLDMTGWRKTIDRVERRTQKAIRTGLFTVVHQERLIVTDRFDDGPELLATAAGFAGTKIPVTLRRRIRSERSPVTIDQLIRLRVLAADAAAGTAATV